MILLSNTDILTLQTLGTGKVDFTAYYADHTTESFALGANTGTVSSITTTNIVAAPTTAVTRQIRTVVVVNRDTTPTAQTVLIKKTVGSGVTFLTANTPLGTGESLEYLGERGWKVLDRQGAVKVQSTLSGPVSALALGPLAAGMGTTTRLHATDSAWGIYVGKSPRYPVSSLQVRWRTTIAAVGTTWAEMGVYVGTTRHSANNAGTGVSVANQLRCIGYADVSAAVATIATQTTTITMLTGLVLPPDEDVWIVFASVFVTSGCTLSASLHDDLASGSTSFITAASRRPSEDLGQAVSLSGVTTLSVGPTFQVYW